MSNTKRLAGPMALTTSAANIFNDTSSRIRTRVTHIHVVNKTTSDANVSFFLGATGASAAGTEFMGSVRKVKANDVLDWYGSLDMASTDFLVGLASANTALTVTVMGEQDAAT